MGARVSCEDPPRAAGGPFYIAGPKDDNRRTKYAGSSSYGSISGNGLGITSLLLRLQPVLYRVGRLVRGLLEGERFQECHQVLEFRRLQVAGLAVLVFLVCR